MAAPAIFSQKRLFSSDWQTKAGTPVVIENLANTILSQVAQAEQRLPPNARNTQYALQIIYKYLRGFSRGFQEFITIHPHTQGEIQRIEQQVQSNLNNNPYYFPTYAMEAGDYLLQQMQKAEQGRMNELRNFLHDMRSNMLEQVQKINSDAEFTQLGEEAQQRIAHIEGLIGALFKLVIDAIARQ